MMLSVAESVSLFRLRPLSCLGAKRMIIDVMNRGYMPTMVPCVYTHIYIGFCDRNRREERQNDNLCQDYPASDDLS